MTVAQYGSSGIRIKRVAVFEEEVMQTQTEILEDVAVIIELVFVLKPMFLGYPDKYTTSAPLLV